MAEGRRTCVMVWCMLAADAIRQFDSLGGDSWILQDVRLGGVPCNYHATLIDISRFLHGRQCDQVELAYLLAEFVTADPLLLETVTRLRATATTAMIEAVDHLGNLTHDQLTIAHHLAVTWLDGPAALAVEAKIRTY
ncbi:MAG: hypothetical protein ACRDGH_06450 [Candidatus Limnocylindria bacterium]